MSLGRRLKQLRSNAEKTQQEISDMLNAIGVKATRVQIARWENNLQEPTLTPVIGLSKIYGVSADYIITGNADNQAKPTKANPYVKATIKAMHSMTDDGKEQVADYATFLDESGKYKLDEPQASLTLSEDYIELYTDARAAAGTGAYNYGYDDGRCVCAKIADVPDYDGIVDVKGDSMNPTIKDGDVAFVDFNFEPVDGKIYIIQHEDDTYIKRCYFESDKLTLKSDNPDYKDIVFNTYDNVRIIGLVTGWATPEQ